MVFWCACLLGFFLLFRKLNLVPDGKFKFNPERQLKHSDIVFTNKNVVVGIRWAKNHQFSKELLTFPLPILPGSVLCSVKALLQLFRMVPGHQQQHLFMLNAQGESLTYRKFQNKLHSQLQLIDGVDANRFSSHSLRRGGTTFSFLSGVPPEVIKLMGNWSSDAYLKYLEFPLEARTAATELIKMRMLALQM